MRKLILFVILVIILVSVAWFRGVKAQDLSSLSPAEIAQLKAKYEQQQAAPKATGTNSYTSPPIFESDSTQSKSYPNPSSGTTLPDSAQTGFESGDRMPAFEELHPFGMELFRQSAETAPPSDIASADDYLLGPGDNVIVYLWGRVEREYNLTLDRDGKVFIPKVGDVIAWGLTLDQFRDRMKKHLSKVYSDFDLTLSLGKIRSIRIYVTGEVRYPGAYTVSSLTSVLNAIFAAGGPNERGSMRSIKVMRGGKAAAEIDLYDLLLEGNNSTDVLLRTGDAIFVPVAGARVAVRGEVKRAAIYELKGDETIRDVFTLAGNPTPEAYLNRVMLERITSTGQWEVRDLDLVCDSTGPCDDIAMTDGDRVTVYSIYDRRTNMVAIAGQVKHPGFYERNDSTRISDLIKRGQLAPFDVYYERADLFRRYADRRTEVIPINLAAALAGAQSDNIVLQDRDSLHVYSIDDVQRDKYVYIEGEVEHGGRFPLYDRMTASDLIFLAGSFRRGANRDQAELARLDSLGNVSVLYLDLSDSLQAKTVLHEDDHLYIRRLPEWEYERSVQIAGEVAFPGTYWLTSHDETLYDLLRRAGGFTANAFPRGTVFERRTIGENLQQLKVPQLVEQSQPIRVDSLGKPVQDQVFKYRPESMNRIILDIDRILATQGTEGDVVLEPGDRVTVPSVPSGISIMGAVAANGTLKYQVGRKVKDYIKRAGDFTRQADKKGTRLIRAGGEVFAGGGVLGEKVLMGDIIVVPSEIKHDRNWGKTITTMLSATAGVLTSVYVISKL